VEVAPRSTIADSSAGHPPVAEHSGRDVLPGAFVHPAGMHVVENIHSLPPGSFARVLRLVESCHPAGTKLPDVIHSSPSGSTTRRRTDAGACVVGTQLTSCSGNRQVRWPSIFLSPL
jgi:hypothetical protein